MTTYINPSTRLGGVERIIVPKRPASVSGADEDAPFDGTQYVRMNGQWVSVDFPVVVPDTLAPSPPTSLNRVGTTTASGTEVNYALTWVAPTTNANATALTDFGYYVVRWRYTGTGPWASFVSNDPSAFLPGLVLNATLEWQVLARDIYGNDSTWAAGA